MNIIKRNLLTIRIRENLDLGNKLLFDPYQNIVTKLVNLSIEREAKDFDPVYKGFSGLESIDKEKRDYYEAFLGVTSYYQASKGGRGKYNEKKISSYFDNCSITIKISEIPTWLLNPELYRKKGINTLKRLTSSEKRILREKKWIFNYDEDETSDIGAIIREENMLILLESKNRVDSGGVPARRELWTKKFKLIFKMLTDNNCYYKKSGKIYNLIDMFKYFNIYNLEIYIGILFNVDGLPATKEGDKSKGFYSANEEGYKDLSSEIKDKGFRIEDDIEKLEINIDFNGLKVKFGVLYGDDILKTIFKSDKSVSDLLILKYDDIWLSQLLAIKERTILLKYGSNCMAILKNLLSQDSNLKKLYDDVIFKEGSYESLVKILEYILKNYNQEFSDHLFPIKTGREEYLSDVIQVLVASETYKVKKGLTDWL